MHDLRYFQHFNEIAVMRTLKITTTLIVVLMLTCELLLTLLIYGGNTVIPFPVRKNHSEYCKDLRKPSNKSSPVAPRRPPWFDLINYLNATSNSTSNSTEAQSIFYVKTQNDGRLGNQMFGYASLFGIAWRNSRIPLWNRDLYGLRKIFNQLRISADYNNTLKDVKFVGVGETGWQSYIGQADKLPLSNIQIQGWLQHWRYFAHVDDQLRYDFTLPPDIIHQAQMMLDAIGASSLREQGYVRVVMHVRRGDYSKRVDGILQRQPDFFNRSMGYFTGCLPKVHFIVISDNSTWCRDKILGERVDFIEDERSPAVDLGIASLCDHAIITIGTFGWWAAWFANGVTLELTDNPGEAMRPPVKLKEW